MVLLVCENFGKHLVQRVWVEAGVRGQIKVATAKKLGHLQVMMRFPSQQNHEVGVFLSLFVGKMGQPEICFYHSFFYTLLRPPQHPSTTLTQNMSLFGYSARLRSPANQRAPCVMGDYLRHSGTALTEPTARAKWRPAGNTNPPPLCRCHT
jgi:hypothetical protein